MIAERDGRQLWLVYQMLAEGVSPEGVAADIDRLREALKLARDRILDLTHEREDMRAERNNAHCLMVEHATAALSSAKELKMATSEIDSLRNELDDALDRIAELEEGVR